MPVASVLDTTLPVKIWYTKKKKKKKEKKIFLGPLVNCVILFMYIVQSRLMLISNYPCLLCYKIYAVDRKSI